MYYIAELKAKNWKLLGYYVAALDRANLYIEKERFYPYIKIPEIRDIVPNKLKESFTKKYDVYHIHIFEILNPVEFNLTMCHRVENLEYGKLVAHYKINPFKENLGIIEWMVAFIESPKN